MQKYEAQFSPMSEGRLDVKVKFHGGKTYYVVFADTIYVESEMKGIGCVAIPGLLILDEVSMERAEEVLDYIVKSGYFSKLMPVKDEDGE